MITTVRPQVDSTGLYTQSHVARILGVDRHTVAKYTESGALKFRVRKIDGRKVMTGQAIIDCWETVYL